MQINGAAVLLIVVLTVLFNGGGFVLLALSTRSYRRRQAAIFAARIAYMTSEQIRDALLDLQEALSAVSLQDLRNKVDHSIDTQRDKGAAAAGAIADQVERGTLASPLMPPDSQESE